MFTSPMLAMVNADDGHLHGWDLIHMVEKDNDTTVFVFETRRPLYSNDGTVQYGCRRAEVVVTAYMRPDPVTQ